VRKEFTDPCEYNPDEKREAYEHEAHASADIILGYHNEWRLCSKCASLDRFKKYRIRKPIKKGDL
jgi:hypothetical protein